MRIFNKSWKQRALDAEASNIDLQTAIDKSKEHLEGIELRFANRAALSNITRDGRKLKFTFIRKSQIYQIICMGTWEDNVEQWKKDLLQ